MPKETLDSLFGDSSEEYFSEDELQRADKLLSTVSGGGQVYQQLGSDLKELQRVQTRIDKLIRIRSSYPLKFEAYAKERVYEWLGKEYVPDSLELVFTDQVTIINSLKHSLGNAIQHSNGVLKHIEDYTDHTVLPELEKNVQNSLTGRSEIGKLNNQYEQSKASLKDTPIKDPNFTQTYRNHLNVERKLRKLRVSNTLSREGVRFRDEQRESLREYEVMAHTVIGLMECLNDMVDASLENAVNLRGVYTLFREGAESIGALNKAFASLKQIMGMHTTKIGDYARTIMNTAGRNKQQPQTPFGSKMSNYTNQVASFARETTRSLEDEANRIMDSTLQ